MFQKISNKGFKVTTNKYFIKFARVLSPIKIFQPIIIKLQDTNKTIVLDIFLDSLKPSNLNADLVMSSESLKFILSFPFGFDTKTYS